MTRSEIRCLISRIRKIEKKWVPALGLEHWSIKFFYQDTSECDPPAEWSASITPQWEYMVADVYINVDVCSLLDDSDLEICIIHELCHCLVAPIAPEGVDKNEERVVSHMTYAFRKVRDLANGGKI